MGDEMSRSDRIVRGGGARLYSIRSDKDSNFTGAVANGSSEEENLTGLQSDKIRIRRVIVISAENLNITIAFFSTDGFQDTDYDVESYIGEVQFLATDGVRITSGTFAQYYYDSGNLDLQYLDEDETGELHVAYVCRSAAGKTAGQDVVVRVLYEPLEED